MAEKNRDRKAGFEKPAPAGRESREEICPVCKMPLSEDICCPE